MKIYVEMTEHEYDFYKKFKENKRLVYNNFTKLVFEYFRQNNEDPNGKQNDFIRRVQDMLNMSYSLFEIGEE